ncbi:LytR/AlgR family response regulator transcription factor [Flavobacterium sp. JP2137]|uniref:LytR/AlgR family response regulator transcription factor n=1 Tax=Flavobacterium sp. JP2137 TaxID=3414510 RepID=UPI003D2FBC32
MTHPFIIVDQHDVEAEKTLESLRLFPHLNCLGIFKNDETLFAFLLSKKPSLVFVAENAFQNDQGPLSFDSLGRIHEYLSNDIYFIYLSSLPNDAFPAIQAGFSDYLITPLKLHLLGNSIARFKSKVPLKNSAYLAIKSYSDYKFVKYADIIYLKADNNTTDIVLTDGRTTTAFNTLKYYQENLPSHFVRIHKSYIVHIEAVHRIHFSQAKCYLNNGEIIPISPNYRSSLEYILDHLQL